MSGTISLAPYATSQPQDSFLLQTQGYMQGLALDDPSVRMELSGGFLASSESLIMWGAVPISEVINSAGNNADGLGPALKRATSQGNTTGFSVYNQAGSMVIAPGQTAPAAGLTNFVPFFRLGCGIRIPVQADPALVSAAAGGLINSQALYWDVTNYRVTLTTSGGNFALPTSITLLVTNTNSKIVSYNSGTGALTWTTGDVAILKI